MAHGEVVNILCRSFAKVNLFLKILGKREDGYSEIRTLYHTIDLCDKLSFKINESGEINLKVEGDFSIPADSSNLVFKAAKLLKEKFGVRHGVDVSLTKKIPVGAGLGGGSSNCATTLLALNRLWNLNLTDEVLCELGGILGADVPFFIRGGLAFGYGRGDEILFLPDGVIDLSEFSLLLIVPDFSISTEYAYRTYRNFLLTKNVYKNKITCLNLEKFSFVNDFEEVIFKEYPVLSKIKKIVLKSGCKICIMSGSGSVLFAIYEGRVYEGIERDLPEGYRLFFSRFLTSKEFSDLVFMK